MIIIIIMTTVISVNAVFFWDEVWRHKQKWESNSETTENKFLSFMVKQAVKMNHITLSKGENQPT